MEYHLLILQIKVNFFTDVLVKIIQILHFAVFDWNCTSLIMWRMYLIFTSGE